MDTVSHLLSVCRFPLVLLGKVFSNSCLLLSEKSSENLVYRFSMSQLAAKNKGLTTVRCFPGTVRASMGKILKRCHKPSCAVRKEENTFGFPSLFQDPHVLLSCLAQCRWLEFSVQPWTHVTKKTAQCRAGPVSPARQQYSPKMVEFASNKKWVLHTHTHIQTCNMCIDLPHFLQKYKRRDGMGVWWNPGFGMA